MSIEDDRIIDKAEGVAPEAGAGRAEQADLLSKVEDFICENGLLQRGDSVLVGLSGGADSVALMNILVKLAPKYDWTVRAAHFNHGIRGVGAEEDELFCRDLCEDRGVPFYSETADVPAYAKENGLSIETAGRLLRYDFLGRVKKSTGCGCIAVAHHMNDNAESILLHLARGSGLAGLVGMKPKRDDIIRPLLIASKKEIEAHLEEEGILYCTDETNLIPDGSRNRIRLDVVPYLEAHINPAIVPTLCSMAELLAHDEEYLAEQARREYEKVRREGGFLRAPVEELPYPIKTRVIRIALAEAGAIVDIERVHVEAIAELLGARTGARLTLPHIEAWTSYDMIKFGDPKPMPPFEVKLHNGLVVTPAGLFRVERIEGTEGFVRSRSIGFLDLDKVEAAGEELVIRTRRDGDRFIPVGAPGRRKLKQYLIDRKVERKERDELPLLACGGEVLFVPGHAASESFKVTESTRRMLKVEYLGRADEME
jgi:tRNA(Ile)-lysidine synthase